MDNFFKELENIFIKKTRKITLKKSTGFSNRFINQEKEQITCDYERNRETGKKVGINRKKSWNDSPDLINEAYLID